MQRKPTLTSRFNAISDRWELGYFNGLKFIVMASYPSSYRLLDENDRIAS